jgi:hypothetical protein
MNRKSASRMCFLFGCALLAQLFPKSGNAQLGVAYHQSHLSFLGVNYEIKNRFKPELRLNTNLFAEDISIEAVALYDVINKDDYEFYVGLGVRSSIDEGIVVPVGLNIYPLPYKNFGFHIEVAAIAGDDGIIRGSWGIRYRFLKKRE